VRSENSISSTEPKRSGRSRGCRTDRSAWDWMAVWFERRTSRDGLQTVAFRRDEEGEVPSAKC
jgi:hypothetical protein